MLPTAAYHPFAEYQRNTSKNKNKTYHKQPRNRTDTEVHKNEEQLPEHKNNQHVWVLIADVCRKR